MDGWMDGRTAGRMDGWMDGCTEAWMHGGMDGGMDGGREGWMDGWMDGCVHVYTGSVLVRLHAASSLLQSFASSEVCRMCASLGRSLKIARPDRLCHNLFFGFGPFRFKFRCVTAFVAVRSSVRTTASG